MIRFEQELDVIMRSGLKRELRCVDAIEDRFCSYNDQRMLNFSSNDYLGIATEFQIHHSFENWLRENEQFIRFGSGSSRLLTGNSMLYHITEENLKTWYGSQAALFFNSGYHANTGVLPALCSKKDLIISDKLCHASIIDGIRLSNAEQVRFRHLDYQQLDTLLMKKRHLYDKVFVVTESVFSMDGDRADLKLLVDLKKKFDLLLYVDEAHAVGVLGNRGLGLSEEEGVLHDVDILIGTMGKALASVGAYVISDESISQLLVNKCRTLIFTTALPSVNMAWSNFIISQVSGLHQRRQRLNQLVLQCNKSVREMGFAASDSYIIPVVVGENETAVQLAQYLQKKGFLIFPIRPPTVPAGTSRLRLSLTSNMELADVESLMQEINLFINKYLI